MKLKTFSLDADLTDTSIGEESGQPKDKTPLFSPRKVASDTNNTTSRCATARSLCSCSHQLFSQSDCPPLALVCVSPSNQSIRVMSARVALCTNALAAGFSTESALLHGHQRCKFDLFWVITCLFCVFCCVAVITISVTWRVGEMLGGTVVICFTPSQDY